MIRLKHEWEENCTLEEKHKQTKKTSCHHYLAWWLYMKITWNEHDSWDSNCTSAQGSWPHPPTSPPPPKRNFPLTEPHRHNRWRLNEPTQIFWFYWFICGFWNNRFQSTKRCPHPITPSNYFPASAHLSMFVCSVPTCLQTRRSHHCFLQLHASPAYLSVNMSEHV